MKKKEINAKLQEIKSNKPSSKDLKAIVQNNVNNVNVEVNLSELGGLAKIDPQLAKEYLEIIKANQSHIQKMDIELIAIEKKEQERRFINDPKDRAYNNKGQFFGFIVMIIALFIVGFAIYNHETSFAITSVVGVLLLSLYHISGKKEQTAISWKDGKKPDKN
ncbi:MAG: hypothetical protein IJ964_05330 [Campylobacter sp.]|nr:hypothetical protein [Campylobacter sp.]